MTNDTKCQEKKEEHFGIIISLKGSYGFIKSNYSRKPIYFKLKSCQNPVTLNEKVVFQLNNGIGGLEAKSIRHIFTNNYGINFAPVVNKHHIHLDLKQFLPLIIQEINSYSEQEIEIEKELDRIVGKTVCLKTSSNDKISYAIRKGKFGHSRFVHNREPIDCSVVFCALERTEYYYIIKTIYIGKKACREPWDEKATVNDLLFWRSHALIFDPDEIIEGSETNLCPWIIGKRSVSRYNKTNYHHQ